MCVKVDFEKKSVDDNKSMNYYFACKEVSVYHSMLLVKKHKTKTSE